MLPPQQGLLQALRGPQQARLATTLVPGSRRLVQSVQEAVLLLLLAEPGPQATPALDEQVVGEVGLALAVLARGGQQATRDQGVQHAVRSWPDTLQQLVHRLAATGALAAHESTQQRAGERDIVGVEAHEPMFSPSEVGELRPQALRQVRGAWSPARVVHSVEVRPGFDQEPHEPAEASSPGGVDLQPTEVQGLPDRPVSPFVRRVRLGTGLEQALGELDVASLRGEV